MKGKEHNTINRRLSLSMIAREDLAIKSHDQTKVNSLVALLCTANVARLGGVKMEDGVMGKLGWAWLVVYLCIIFYRMHSIFALLG